MFEIQPVEKKKLESPVINKIIERETLKLSDS